MVSRAPRLRYWTNREGKLEAIMDNRPSPPLKHKPVYRPPAWAVILALAIWGGVVWVLTRWLT